MKKVKYLACKNLFLSVLTLFKKLFQRFGKQADFLQIKGNRNNI